MRIARDRYLNQLIARKHNGLVKVITGVRRCGKSYLLFELFREHLRLQGVDDDRIVSIQLDDWGQRALRDPGACYEYVRQRATGTGRSYVLIDEVQLMPDFVDVLNGLMHLDGVDVYVTGSNSRLLSSDVVTEFRGRGDQVRVHPLSFSEYYGAVGGDWDEALDDYMTYGGMPQLVALAGDSDKASYLVNLFNETYLRDIIERNGVRNVDELGELVDVIASSVGSLTNPARLEATFKSVKRVSLSAATIKTYLSHLEDAFLISCAKRYDVKGRSYIGTPLKYYFEDVGLRNARLGFRQQEPTHIMENVVYNELVRRGFLVDVGVVDAPARTGEGGGRVEIDFVANMGPRRYYVQSAYALPTGEKRAQEVRPLLAVRDSFKKVVVVGGSHKPDIDQNGIVTMGLKQFLLDDRSLEY